MHKKYSLVIPSITALLLYSLT